MALGRNLGTGSMGSGRMSTGSVGAGRTSSIGGAGKPAVPPSRAEKRMASIKESMQSSKTTATSAAHAGVVARPMDKNLSKMLEQRRAQMQSSGTSVARLGKEGEMNPRESLSTHLQDMAPIEQPATSVGRLGKGMNAPSYLPPPPQKPPNKPPTSQPPVIDVFGDL